MATTSIVERMAGDGLQQHLHAEPTTVAECLEKNKQCFFDADCCWGLLCNWWLCEPA